MSDALLYALQHGAVPARQRRQFACFSRVGAIFLFSLLLVGCNSTGYSTLRPADVVGTYQAQVDYGVGAVVLNPNGTFSQTFTYKSGRVVRHNGTWTFSKPNSVFLNNALVIGQNLGAPHFGLTPGNWGLQVDSLGPRKWIEFDPDKGWCLHKVK